MQSFLSERLLCMYRNNTFCILCALSHNFMINFWLSVVVPQCFWFRVLLHMCTCDILASVLHHPRVV